MRRGGDGGHALRAVHRGPAAGLRQQPPVYVDETSWWLGGASRWLWGFTTSERTVYRVDTRRGRDVVLEAPGDAFGGVLVSDCLASYENVPHTMHKCYAHHLKAITEARDRAPPDVGGGFDDLALVLKAALALKDLVEFLRPQLTLAQLAGYTGTSLEGRGRVAWRFFRPRFGPLPSRMLCVHTR